MKGDFFNFSRSVPLSTKTLLLDREEERLSLTIRKIGMHFNSEDPEQVFRLKILLAALQKNLEEKS